MGYDKPWLSYDDQLDRLVSRGLVVTDRDQPLAERREAAPFGENLRALMALPRKDQDQDAIPAADAQLKALTQGARALDSEAEDVENQLYDLKAVNPNKKSDIDTHSPAELLDLIETKGSEIAETLAVLRRPVEPIPSEELGHPGEQLVAGG